jgi:O-antigen ligase
VLILAAGALTIPILYSGGLDVFNLPKELAFRAEAIALLAAGVLWATSAHRTWSLRGSRRAIILAAVVVAWAAITTLTSTNRPLSADSLITVAAAAVIFVATAIAAQTMPIVAVDILMAGACLNVVMVILQELKIWSPFVHAAYVSGHYESVGFLGNANYVGTYLAMPALAAIVLAVVATGKRRWIYAAIAALLIAGIAVSATRTAIGALVAGLAMLSLRSRRAALAMAAALAVVALLTLSPRTALGERVRDFIDAASKRDYERLFSERLLPALAAIDMTRDHPLLGVGPGCFRFHFMAYRLRLDQHYPKNWTRGYPGNWSAAHNDHLQVAAETGLPGYALFLAVIGLGAGFRRQTQPKNLEGSFARALRWPLAVLFLVLCLAQFPLELAAPRLMLITLGALCMTWDDDDASV